MNSIRKVFKDFKSIFIYDDVLQENERQANIVTATIMFNCFIAQIVISFLCFVDVLELDKNTILLFLLNGILFLFIPSIVCFIMKGKGKYLKYILLFILTYILASISSLFTYTVILGMVLPIILAARYYSKKFTMFTAVSTIVMFGIAAYIGSYRGFTDLNYIDVPKGTNITINTTLEDAVNELKIDQRQKSENIMLQSYLPQVVVYCLIVVFACVKISKSGKTMVDRQKKLTEETTRVESELNIAKNIQSNILETEFPAFPNREEFDIYASMIPAKEVGGDFYDMFLIDDSHLAIGIADVSGKGVPGALIMMNAKVLIQSTALSGKSVDEVFNIVNNELCKKNKLNHFITSWFGIIDLTNGKLEYVNAGHNPPLIYKKSEDKFEYLKTKHNLTLAAMENIKYTKHVIMLNPGDKIFLYTDGVTEATNENNELYSEERLQTYLNNNITDDLNKTINEVKKDIDNFVGNREQFDDITMLEFCLNDYLKETYSRKFKTNTNELSNIMSYLNENLNKDGISQKIINQLELVIEELFVNVCNYAYEDNNGYLKISLQTNDNKIIIILEDEGIKFNPLEKEEPDTTLSIEERNVGGLGILLAKKNLDNIKYKREDNKNILILEKIIKEDK